MATTLSKAESRRLYSWWWNSHISPKNSKWLQENLADMDIMIKSMIKLLEEEADSFARRAEMYYKKRPELLKLVEEFYRAYRALAERYDHATRVLHQAQRTMADAFPNQMPLVLPDELHSGFPSTDQDSHSFEKNSPAQTVLDTDKSEKDTVFPHITLKPFNSGRIRKGMDFQDERKNTENEVYGQFREIQNLNLWEREDVDEEIKRLQEEISQLSKENNDLDDKMSLQSCRADKAESEVQMLQDSLSRFISDKEAALLHYQLSLEKISNLEAEISRTHEEVKKLNEEKFSEQQKLTSVSEQYLALEKAKLALEIALRASESKKIELTDQLEALNQNLKSSGAFVEGLKIGNMQLRDLCEKNKIEKVLLREEKFVLENSLSDANSEIETLRENIKNLEASLESLRRQIAVHVPENAALVSQVEDISQKMEELTDNNTLLEISSNVANLELASLRGKLKDFGESFQTLSDQNSTISAEKNALLSQVNNISQNLNLLEIRHSELQEKNTNLERERNSIRLQVIALEEELKVEKQGHEDLIQSSKEQQATLENQINILQEECRRREDLVELEQQRIMKGQIDIFILQGCLREVEEVNAVLAAEHHTYLEKSKGMEKTIASLREEIERQGNKMSSLEKENEKLRGGFANVLKDLNSMDNFRDLGEADDEILVGLVQKETREMLGSLSSCEDENQNLALENMIISTLLKQFGLSMADLKLEKVVLEEELGTKRAKLLEMNALMNYEIRVRNEREEASRAEMRVVCRRLSDLQEAHHSLRSNNFNILEEQKSLLKNFCDVREMKSSLEEENSILLSEASKLDVLLLISQSINSERALEMKSLGVDMRLLLRIRDDLEQEITVLHEKLSTLEIDNSNLKESVKNLDLLRGNVAILEEDLQEANRVISQLSEYGVHKEDEIVALIQEKDSLNHEIRVRNEREEASRAELGVVCRQLSDLQEAHHLLCSNNSDILEEHKSLLKNFCKVREMKSSLEEENSFLLSEASKLDFLLLIFQSFNSERASEVKSLGVDMELLLRIRNDLEQEVRVLHGKLSALEVDNSNLKESVINLDALRSHAAVLEEDLQEANSVISRLSEDGARKDDEIAALVQAKKFLNWEIKKLNKEIGKLENREAYLISELQKGMGEIGFCESEIGELLGELQVAATNAAVFKENLLELPSAFRGPEVGSTVQEEKIKDLCLGDVAYLEELKEEVIDDLEGEDAYMARIVSLRDGISSLDKSLLSLAIRHKEHIKKKQGDNKEEIEGDSRANPETRFLDLQILHSKVEGLLGLVKEMETHLDKEKSSSGGETDSRDIAKRKGNQIFEAKHREVMKDIELDRVSCSSPAAGVTDSYKSRTIEIIPSELPAIQSSFQDYGRNPSKRIEEVLFVSGSQEIKHDKGLSVEKLEFSEKVPEAEKEWRNRVLGRLSFDAERLALLQASAEEQWRKVAAIENVENGPPSFELDILKAQLKEAEGAIRKLIQTNNFLTERAASPSQSFRSLSVEEPEEARRTRRGKTTSGEIMACSDSFDNLAVGEEKEVGRGRRRRISMHARRGSEKVQSLELELEKIDYILLKLKEKQEYYAAGKAAMRSGGRRRVSLSNYLYGRSGSSRRRYRVPFCSCVRTRTDSD